MSEKNSQAESQAEATDEQVAATYTAPNHQQNQATTQQSSASGPHDQQGHANSQQSRPHGHQGQHPQRRRQPQQPAQTPQNARYSASSDDRANQSIGDMLTDACSSQGLVFSPHQSALLAALGGAYLLGGQFGTSGIALILTAAAAMDFAVAYNRSPGNR